MSTFMDITGQRFGRLIVLRRAPNIRRNLGQWVCRCDCGKETLASAGKLRYHHKRSCGCLKDANRHVPPTKDVAGHRFGRLVAQAIVGKTRRGESRWRCQCDCGREVVVKVTRLRETGRARAQSCGCLALERSSARARVDFAANALRSRLPLGEASLRAVLAGYRRVAKVRNQPFELSDKVFRELILKDCFYCGAPPSNTYLGRRMYGACIYNGIDRVDNQLGYIEGNVVPCCGPCNRGKSTLSLAEFYAWIERVYLRKNGADLASGAA